MSREKVVALFNSVRDADYAGLKKTLQPLLKTKKADADAAAAELERATRQFRDLREIDFFESPRGHEVAMLLLRLEQKSKTSFAPPESKGLPRQDLANAPAP